MCAGESVNTYFSLIRIKEQNQCSILKWKLSKTCSVHYYDRNCLLCHSNFTCVMRTVKLWIEFVNYSVCRSLLIALHTTVRVCAPADPALIYDGHLINKLQNGAISSGLKIGTVQNIRFVGILFGTYIKIWWWRHYCDVICSQNIVYLCIFSPPVFCHNSQVINNIVSREKMNKLNKLILPL